MRNATIKTLVVAVLLWIITIEQSEAASREVWLISTHRVCGSCSGTLESQPVRTWRLENECQWISADLPSLLRSDDPTVPTLIFVHGYVVRPDDAIHTGVRMAWPLYSQLCGDAQGRPFRLVVWTWPAEQATRGKFRGLRADVLAKGMRTDTESILLGQLLDRIQPLVPVTLVGDSFGCRIVGGALELLGGGQIDGCGLSRKNTAPRVPVRAMLVAAAMDADWLLPGHRNGVALSQVDQMFITVNHSDPLLRRYPRMYGADALGFVGPACLGCLGSEQTKLDLLDVTCAVGRDHHWSSYIACSSVLGKLGSYTFRQPRAGAADSAETETPTTAKAQPPRNHKSLAAN